MECFNCLSLLDEKNNLFLPKCGHSFCKECLAIQQPPNGNELTCSSCNTKSDVLSIPNYLSVYPMLADDSMDARCGVCEEAHPATRFCVDCSLAICEDVHHQSEFHQYHVVITIEEYHQCQQAHRHLGFLHPKSCIRHKRPFEFLDLNAKARNELLCSECLTETHTSLARLSDCTFSLLHEKLDHIRELGSQGTAHLAELREEEDYFTSRLKGLEESRARSLSEIRRVFLSLHEALQTRQSELEREVEELSKSAGFALSEERERSRVWQGQLLLLEKCVEEINSNPLPSFLSIFTSPPHPSPPPSGLYLKKRPLPPPPSPEFLSEKTLMVDACLLEDALRNSLSSSRASSSLTDVHAKLKISKIRDQIEFSYPSPSDCSISPSLSISSSPLTFSTIEKGELSVTSSTFCPFRSYWSKNNVQSVMTFYSQGGGLNQLCYPDGLAYSPELKLFYVSDCYNHRIQVFRNRPQAEREGRVEIETLPPLGSTGSSSVTSSVSGLPMKPIYTAPPSLTCPRGLFYRNGQLFIVDQEKHRVQVWRAEDGSFLHSIGTGIGGRAVGQTYHPSGCTVYQNHLYISDTSNHRIQKFSLFDFSVVKVIGSYGRELGQLNSPKELSVFNGKLYVADCYNHRICVFDPESGAALSVIGPSLPNDGNLSNPYSLLFSHNLLFVSSQHRISVFDSDHNYLYSFGSQGSGRMQFSNPTGMVMVDEKLFVCDSNNGRINVFSN